MGSLKNYTCVEDEDNIFYEQQTICFEHKFFSIHYGTGLFLTPEDGNHSISLLGSKLYFLDTFSSLINQKHIIKRVKNE